MQRPYLVGVLIVAALQATPSYAQDTVAPHRATPRATPLIPMWVLHLDNHVTIKVPLEGKEPFTVEGSVVDAGNTEVQRFAVAGFERRVFEKSLSPFAPGTYYLVVIVTDADGKTKALNYFPEVKVSQR
jgi:hypothetical protein